MLFEAALTNGRVASTDRLDGARRLRQGDGVRLSHTTTTTTDTSPT